MRVNFVLPSLTCNGGNRVLVTHACALKARGHDVTLIARDHRATGLRARIKNFISPKFADRTHRQALEFFKPPHPEVRIVNRRRDVSDAEVPDADIVIATWCQTAEWVAQLSPQKGLKTYFVQHFEALWFPEGSPLWQRVERTYQLGFRHIVVSRWLQEVLRDRGFDPDATLVSNSVDFEQFYSAPRTRPSSPVVGFVYSPMRFKGMDIARDAITTARKSIPNLRVVAFGSCSPTPEYPVPEECEYTWLPPQASLRKLYGCATCWIVPSRQEGFGLPLIEAMACRTPVVSTPAGGAPEIAEKGGLLLVPPEDPRAMAQAIVHVCSLDDAAWKTLSEAAYANVTRHTWDDASRQLEGALAGFLKHGAPVAAEKDGAH